MHEIQEHTPQPLTVAASVLTDPGCVRETNEDNGRHISPSVPVDKNERGTLTIVADGMGGHSSGEVASEMAVELIGRYFYDNESDSVEQALRQAIEQASADIFDSAIADTRLFGMGTTVVALVIRDNAAWVAHVGDSRLYRLRGSHMELLTMDHSQVMEMVKMGLLSFDEAQSHDDKNVILRAVGTQPNVEVEISGPFEVVEGDQFLLCSDGLCDMVPDEEIAGIWSNSLELHDAVQRLVEVAKQRGGSDNITVAIVRASARLPEIARKVPVTKEIEVHAE